VASDNVKGFVSKEFIAALKAQGINLTGRNVIPRGSMERLNVGGRHWRRRARLQIL
jgi:hypothetical protein